MSDPVNIHGTGLVLDGRGLLLRGPSGAGKSLLALELLNEADLRGQKSALVADDRIDLSVERGKLVMRAPQAIAGLIELRGRGIVSRPHVKRAEVHLVVDLVGELVRLIEEDALQTQIEGIAIARCPVPNRNLIDSAHQKLLIDEALRQIASAKRARAKKPLET